MGRAMVPQYRNQKKHFCQQLLQVTMLREHCCARQHIKKFGAQFLLRRSLRAQFCCQSIGVWCQILGYHAWSPAIVLECHCSSVSPVSYLPNLCVCVGCPGHLKWLYMHSFRTLNWTITLLVKYMSFTDLWEHTVFVLLVVQWCSQNDSSSSERAGIQLRIKNIILPIKCELMSDLLG